jgi:arylsulfatase A-like enzyme
VSEATRGGEPGSSVPAPAPRPATRPTSRLAGALVVALLAAGLDTVLARERYAYRPRDFELFLQSLCLWLAFTAVALVPAWAADAWLARRTRDPAFGHPARATARLAAWLLAPFGVHACLDQFTAVGGDTSRLGTLEPWVAALATVLALVLAAMLAGRGLQRVPPLASGAVLAALAVIGGRWIELDGGGGSHAPPPAPPEAPAARTNVLLLVWDTTRAQSLSLYGYPRETTPELDRLARSSLRFSNARSASVYTLTSHISMLTGVYPSHHGARVVRQRFDPRRTPPVVEDFRRAGYRTAAFVGTDVLRARSGVSHGFEVYDDQVDPWVTYTHGWAFLHDVQAVLSRFVRPLHNNGLPHWIQDFQRPAADVLRDAGEWIALDDPRPWFCMVNLYDAHWPYLPAEPARAKWVEPYDGPADGFSHRSDRVRDAGYHLRDEDHRHIAQLYDAELCELDAAVARFLAGIDLERTALVVTSDHGEAIGEGEPPQYEHANMLDCQTRVPLLVRPAGGAAERVVDAPVGGVDVAPTLLALAGLEARAGMLGRNLLGELPSEHSLLVEDRDHPDRRYMKLALWSGPWKLVRFGVPPGYTWYLYRAEEDPEDLRDLAAEHPDVVARLRSEMDDLRARWKADDERDMLGTDVGNRRTLEALGYYDQAKH